MWKRLLILALVVACDQQPAPRAVSHEWITFEGSWTTTGTRHILDFAPGERAGVFDVGGTLMLTSSSRDIVGFNAQAIGFSDSRDGLVGRCTWTDERGDRIFSEIKGGPLGAGSRITGTFVGGTGRFSGITGEYELQWQYVVDSEDRSIAGRATGLKGRAKIR